MRKHRCFYVIIFRIGAEVLSDFGWANNENQFLYNMRGRVKTHEKYKEIRKRIANIFYRYLIEDITRYNKRTLANKSKIDRIVISLKSRI
ncbi:MAG: hypothetical protein AAB432_01235 [Patescibacteria group bacterium]